ncbi:hypothetical protein GGR56DRAFT_632372 [Xylariaceae sp. FL0804]|nr:hypothetical protein GGR56DRAFT_632372 [Xylariaceae sp. FL0804]
MVRPSQSHILQPRPLCPSDRHHDDRVRGAVERGPALAYDLQRLFQARLSKRASSSASPGIPGGSPAGTVGKGHDGGTAGCPGCLSSAGCPSGLSWWLVACLDRAPRRSRVDSWRLAVAGPQALAGLHCSSPLHNRPHAELDRSHGARTPAQPASVGGRDSGAVPALALVFSSVGDTQGRRGWCPSPSRPLLHLLWYDMVE